VYLDFEMGDVCYYDSLVSNPSKMLLKDIKMLIDKVKPDHYMKLKVNNVKEQSDYSNNCGFFASRFICDMYAGKKFKNATRYTDAHKREEDEIEEWKEYL
jgi:hypothetical protein